MLKWLVYNINWLNNLKFLQLLLFFLFSAFFSLSEANLWNYYYWSDVQQWDNLVFSWMYFKSMITLLTTSWSFYMQAHSKKRVPVLTIIAPQRDNMAWWKFTSWCRGWATHDHDHVLIKWPKMCWLNTHFLSGWEVEIYTKENKNFLTFWIDDKYHILRYYFNTFLGVTVF